MDRQPNFGLFLPPSFGKQSFSSSSSSQNNKTNGNQSSLFSSQNQSLRQNNSLIVLHELPETEFPTTQRPVQFYKIRERMTSWMFTTRIGYRIRQYSRVEDDYICYLVQLLMTECNWLKIFIIQPNYLYFEMNSMSTQKQSLENNEENQKEQIQLENRVFSFLKLISQQFLNPFLDSQLQPNILTNGSFEEDELIQSFQKEVISKVKAKYEQTFSKKSKKTENKK